MTEPRVSYNTVSIPRCRIARRIFALLDRAQAAGSGEAGLVHVHGAYGFGKRDVAAELERRSADMGRPVATIDLGGRHDRTDEGIVRDTLVRVVADSLGRPRPDWNSGAIATGNLGAEALRCLVEVCEGEAARPLILVQHAEYVLTAERFAASFLTSAAAGARAGELPFDLVTFANFPLDILTGDSFVAQCWRQFPLRPFPVHEDAFAFLVNERATDGHLREQDDDAREDVAQWIVERCAKAHAASPLARLGADDRLVRQLCDTVIRDSGGHPAISIRLLDTVLAGIEQGRRLSDVIVAETARWGEGKRAIRVQLFPETENTAKYPGSLAQTIATSLQALISFQSTGRMDLNEVAEPDRPWLRFWAGLGFIVDRSAGGKPDWQWSAPFISSWADAEWLRTCDERLRAHVQEFEADRRKSIAQQDKYLEVVEAKVRQFFCETPTGRQQRAELAEAKTHVVEPELHYRFQLNRESSRQDEQDKRLSRKNGRPNTPVVQEIVHVFRNLTETGEQLWMQHYNVLRRLTMLRNPALPQVFWGGRIEDPTEEHRALGYLQLRNPGEPLYSDFREVLGRLREPRADDNGKPAPALVVAQAAALCEAVSLLHAQGIAHRRIDLKSVLVRHEMDPPIQLVLSGFEFAMVLSAIIQSGGAGARNVMAERRTDINLFFAAPETLVSAIAYPTEAERHYDTWLETDIHALGVLLAFMFAGPPTEQEANDTLALLRAGENSPALDTACKTFHAARFALLTDEARWVQAGAGHPVCYHRLLAEMRMLVRRCLSDDPETETSIRTAELSTSVSRMLTNYERCLLDDGRRFAVVFDQRHMGENLARMGVLEGDANSEGGRARVRALIGNTLKTADWFHYRPEGFTGSASTADQETREAAKYLITCDQLIFFAAYYRMQSTRHTDEKLLRLSFTLYRNEIRLPALEDDEKVRVPGTIDVFASDEVGDIPRANYQSWKSLLDRIERYTEHPQALLASASWHFHRELELAAETIKQFPVTVKRTGREVELRLDTERFSEQLKGHRGFYYSLLMQGRDRVAFFIDTIAELQDEMAAGSSKLMFVREGDASPKRFDLGLLRVEADYITVAGSDLLTKNGRLFFSDFYGTQSASRRQRDAIEALIRNASLFDHLHKPHADAPALVPISPACGKDFDDETRRVIQNMKSCIPIAALQGPPGTGKTTTLAELVAELLHDDDSSRILITSQSHAATDTTMAKVLATIAGKRQSWGEVEPEPDAIRIEPRTGAERVSEAVRRTYTSAAIAKKKLAKMRDKADRFLDDHGSGDREGAPGLLQAYEALKEASEKSAYELRRRIERSAPLVFGTTAASEQARDFLRSPNKYFDVVIVDEAAKAWGIDLVQPLSVGARAILVGDHKQLPPFNNEGVADLFRRARDRYVNAMSKDRQGTIPEGVSYICNESRFEAAQAWLQPFQRFFNEAKTLKGDEVNSNLVPVTQTLGTQHRSLAPIGELVSKTFYAGDVKTAEQLRITPRDLPLRLPAGDKEIAPIVAWIDTGGRPESAAGARSESGGKLYNDGEAKIIRALLSRYRYEPGRETPPHERCRILAPYAYQVARMRQLFVGDFQRFGVSSPEELDRIVQTVDSAQGAEADLVVVSMTRNRRVPPDNNKPESHNRALWRSYGFLRSSERLNVMFSRARMQLIIVGDFDFFAAFESAAQAWIETIDDEAQRKELNKRLGFWGRLIAHFPGDTNTIEGPIVRIKANDILLDRP